MIASVVREYKWSPDVIGDLFFDAEDYRGLEYWYNDVAERSKKMNEDLAAKKRK